MRDQREQHFFTVVIAVYNCEKYILQTLKSVSEQTCTDYEVVIVDDCSTDRTNEIISGYIGDKADWHLYRNEINIGVALSRNKAFDLSEGEYIAILDGDDVWYPEKLECQKAIIMAEKVQLCYTSYSFIDEDSKRYSYIYQTKRQANYQSLLKENYIGCATAVFSSEIAKTHPMDPDVAHEDYLYWLTILKNGHKALGIQEPLAYYRIHSKGRSDDKVKASGNRFDIYYRHEKLGLIRSVFYFLCYGANALIKHMKLRQRSGDAH